MNAIWLAAAVVGGMWAVGCASPAASSSASSAEAESTTKPAAVVDAAHVVLTSFDSAKEHASCSGVLLSDSLVLTAAHCIDKASSTLVRSPYAGKMAWSTTASVASAKSDVALVRLTTPIVLEAYPKVSSTVVADGVQASMVRRAFTKKTNKKAFVAFETHASELESASLSDFFAIEHHARIVDTGGPVYSSNGRVIGVVAGLAEGTPVAARLSAINAWLVAELAKASPHTALALGADGVPATSGAMLEAPKAMSKPATDCAGGTCANPDADADDLDDDAFQSRGSYGGDGIAKPETDWLNPPATDE